MINIFGIKNRSSLIKKLILTLRLVLIKAGGERWRIWVG
jgi:hypothetical protein